MDLKLLADQTAKLTASEKTPAAMAAQLKKEYKAEALEVAEKCLAFYPGTKNVQQAEYWRMVCANIISSKMTRH